MDFNFVVAKLFVTDSFEQKQNYFLVSLYSKFFHCN